MKKTTPSHIIKLPYGGNIARVWRNIEHSYYSVGIFNPKKIRRGGGHYFRFYSWNKVKEHIRHLIKNHIEREAIKKADRVASKAIIPTIISTYSKGDFLYTSWGWEQTNIDFVQIIDKTTSRLMVRAVEKKSVEQTGHMSGKCSPVRNAFLGPVFYLSIRPNGKNSEHFVRGSYTEENRTRHSVDTFYKTSETESHYYSWYA
jgi:hypothetical protein